jgi:hypothetical protein
MSENNNNNKNIIPMTYGEMGNFANIVMQSRMFTSIQSTQQALLTMVAGREMGMGFIEACNSLYIVNGKVSLLAGKVGEMIKRSGRYDYRIKEHTNEICIIEFLQKSLDGSKWESIGESKFDLKDKEQAKLSGMNYDKYPRNMLFARALTNGARWHCPDVFGGAIYDPEELGAKVEYSDDGESVKSVEVPEQEKPTWKEPVAEISEPTVVPNNTNDSINMDFADDVDSNDLVVDGEIEHELTVVSTEKAQDLKGNPYQKYVFAEVLMYMDKYGRKQTCEPEWRASKDAYTKYVDIHEQLKNGDKVCATLKVNETTWKGRDSKFQNVEAFGDINPELQDIDEDENFIEVEEEL